jgi:hypothetical protein
MLATASVFLDFNLPNATTWFYFSFLLAVALFFKFARLLSIRNWDVVTLFLLVPGFLVIESSRLRPAPTADHPAVQAASLVGQAYAPNAPVSAAGRVSAFLRHPHPAWEAARWRWLGYLWLLCGSAYFFGRCLFDLVLVQRPALAPNLTFGGLAWLAGALLICLTAVAFRQPDRGPPAVENITATATSVPLVVARQWAEPPGWALRLAAVLCHVAVVAGLLVVGGRHFGDGGSGMAAATLYLMLPYTGMYVSQLAHAWPVALVVWAVAAYRRPTLAGALLGLASATAVFPALVLPAWIGFYWKRGAGRFLAAFVLAAAACLGTVGYALWTEGALDATLHEVLVQTAWQPWKTPVTEGFWTGIHAAYRIPVFVAYLAFVLASAVWPAPKNLAHLLALSAAALVGIQLWYADQGGTYVLWYLPLLLLLVFRPNLHDHRAPVLDPDNDWLLRGRRGLVRFFRWVARVPEHEKTNSI